MLILSILVYKFPQPKLDLQSPFDHQYRLEAWTQRLSNLAQKFYSLFHGERKTNYVRSPQGP